MVYFIWSVLDIFQVEKILGNDTITNVFKTEIGRDSIQLLSNLGAIAVLLLFWLFVRSLILSGLFYWLKLVRKNKDIMSGMSKLDYSIKNYKDLVEETEIGSVEADRDDWEDTFDDGIGGQDVYACNNKVV
ncbi:hypothetical protein LOD99_2832 [Oopsacas minuta]|uniref:Uncharacterized protein n=1 Tax=Oopsacas minuta TaxID=111878 RepID=A0AAV7K2L1_9METZ|nr:hypothetical protein LOD99_2832 [Oopsacas minuta]